MIKNWIDSSGKYKITFNLAYSHNIYSFSKYKSDISDSHINGPAVFIFITEKKSIFGSYGSKFVANAHNWVSDQNAFLFSLNLNKKYPAKKAKNNYKNGYYGYNFHDIELDFFQRKGKFKIGLYLDNYELEGNSDSFKFEHFLVFEVKIEI